MPEVPPPRRDPNLTLVVLVAAATSYALLQSLVIPALPDIQQAVGTTQSGVSWLLTAFLLSASVATPIFGRLGDMYGKERMLLATVACVVVGAVVAALATSIELMILGRVIQGVGAGVFPLGFGIVRDEFPRDRIAQGLGLLSSLFGIGAGVGLLLAGPIVDGLDYHFLFWLPGAFALLTLVAIKIVVPPSPVTTPGRVNWGAAALLSAGMVLLLLAISQSESWGWADARTLGGIVLGFVVLGVWVLVEVRAHEPLVDMKMMSRKGVWTTNLVTLLVGMGMYASFILAPGFVQAPRPTGFGSSIIQAGIFLLPQSITMVLTGQFSGRIERRVGSRVALMAGSAFVGAGFLWLALSRGAGWEVYVALAVTGVGFALVLGAMPNLIVEHVSQAETGVATGMNAVTRTVGGAVGAQIAATVLAGTVDAAGLPTAAAYTTAFTLCAGALGAAALLGMLIPRRHAVVTATRARTLSDAVR